MVYRNLHAISLLVTSTRSKRSLFRIEILTSMKVQQVTAITKFRPLLIIFIAITSAATLGGDVWYTAAVEPIGNDIFNIFLIILFVGLIAMITFSGVRISSVLRRYTQYSGSERHYKFLKRVRFSIF